jgi:Flp pilus assembly protein TadG
MRRVKNRRPDGQGLVEMALVLPIFLAVLLGFFDMGRYVYVRAVLTANAVAAARLAALPQNEDTDCAVLSTADAAPGGFPVPTQDPKSYAYAGNTQGGQSTVPNGSAYTYIYPAIAQNSSTCAGTTDRTGAGTPASVTVTITCVFQPISPAILVFAQSLTVVASSTQPTEY